MKVVLAHLFSKGMGLTNLKVPLNMNFEGQVSKLIREYAQ